MKGFNRLLNLVLVLSLIFTSISVVIVNAELGAKEYDPSTSLLYDDFTTGFGNGTGKYCDMSNFKLDADGPWTTPTYGTIAKSVCLDQFADGSLTYYNENFGNALFSMIVRFGNGYTGSDAFGYLFNDPKVKWRTVALQRDGYRYEIYAGADLANMSRVQVTDFTYYTEMNGGNGPKDLFIEYEINSLPADTKYVKVLFKKADYSNPWQDGTSYNATNWLSQDNEKAARIVITDDKSKSTTKPFLTTDNFTTGTSKMFAYLERNPFAIIQGSNQTGTLQSFVLRNNDDFRYDPQMLCAYRIDDPQTATLSLDGYYWPMGKNGDGGWYDWNRYTTDINSPDGHMAQLQALINGGAKLQIWESADGMVYTQCNDVNIDLFPSNTWDWTGPYHKAVYNVTGFKADTKFVKIVSPIYGDNGIKKSDPAIGEIRLTHSSSTPVNEITQINVASNNVNGVKITSDDNYEGIVIVAVYDADNNLVTTQTKSVAAADYVGNVADVSLNLGVPAGGTKIKALFWDSLNTIKPLVNALESR